MVAAFGGALLAPWLVRLAPARAAALLALVPAAISGAIAFAQLQVAAGETLESTRAWIPSLGIEFAFRLDGLSSLFALLVAGIGTLVVVYAAAYLRGHPGRGRFYAFLLAFLGLDARARAGRRPVPAVRVLGADDGLVVSC